jgi:hypothetical protein
MKKADRGSARDYTLICDQLRKDHAAAMRTITDECVSFREAQKLAGITTEVRTLLSAWLSAGSNQGVEKRLMNEVREIRDQYLDLEGMIKERRNNLETR